MGTKVIFDFAFPVPDVADSRTGCWEVSHLPSPEVCSAVGDVHTEAPRRGPRLRGFNGAGVVG